MESFFSILVAVSWIIPVIAFLGLGAVWFYTGRDSRLPEHIVPQFEIPEGITPAEAGVIIDERLQNKDISAALLHLVVQGYVKMNRFTNDAGKIDYVFQRAQGSETLLKPFEQFLRDGIFRGYDRNLLSIVGGNFYVTSFRDIENQVYESLTSEAYFQHNPLKTRRRYRAIGGVFILMGLGSGFFAPMIMLYSLVATGIIFLLFSPLMPSRTFKGTDMRQQLLGLKIYLERAEKKMLDFLNNPQDNPQEILQYLPYAIALHVNKPWVREFSKLFEIPPEWLEENDGVVGLFDGRSD